MGYVNWNLLSQNSVQWDWGRVYNEFTVSIKADTFLTS
jgi:hypothetical protein